MKKNWRDIAWCDAEYRRIGNKTFYEEVEGQFELYRDEDDKTPWNVCVGIRAHMLFEPMDREVGIMRAGFVPDGHDVVMLSIYWGEGEDDVWSSERSEEIEMCLALLETFEPEFRQMIENDIDGLVEDTADNRGPYGDYEPEPEEREYCDWDFC